MNNEKDVFHRNFENLESLADTINELLQCPVTIEDANHKLLAYSSHDAATDQARIATIIGRRVPGKVVQTLWQKGVIPQLMRSAVPIRVSAIKEIGLGDRIAIAIKSNQEVLGYIWVLENEKKLDELAIQRLIKAAESAKTKLLHLQTKNRKTEQEYQDFFRLLLNGFIQSDTEIKEKAKRLGFSLPASFCVAIWEFKSEITEKLQQEIRYQMSAASSIGSILHVINRNQYIFLAEPPRQNGSLPKIFDPIFEQGHPLADSIPAAAGRGCIYGDYTLAEKSYQEALTVLQIKRQFPEETKNMNEYAKLGYYRFLPLILEEKRTRPLEDDGLQKLKRYDSQSNGNLLHTLEIFLRRNSSVKETANALHIHPNTLNYRLKRIAEVGNIDLNNMNQKVTLYLELQTEKLGNGPFG